MVVNELEKEIIPEPSDDHHDEEQNAPGRPSSSRRSAFRALVEDFGPIWYVWGIMLFARRSANVWEGSHGV